MGVPLPVRFSSHLERVVSAFRSDEFPKHAEEDRKTGAELPVTRRRPRTRGTHYSLF